jgi:hypothetical protein
MKICKRCLVEKNEADFYVKLKNGNALRDMCISCCLKYNKSYAHSINGLIVHIFCDQKKHAIIRSQPMPNYSLQEFKKWMLSQDNFLNLYQDWKNSDFEKAKRPSTDRINDFLSYSLDNIMLTTWADNKRKATLQRIMGIGSAGLICKAIIQIDIQGNIVAEFVSTAQARKDTGISGIINVLKGRKLYAGGFLWKYKEDSEREFLLKNRKTQRAKLAEIRENHSYYFEQF